MMNDDDKMNDSKEISQEEPKTEKTAEENGEKKQGKVIPFDPKAETNAALEAAQTALNDAVANMRSAFSDLKKQMAPLADTLRDVKNAINEGTQQARNAAEAAAAERKAAEKANSDENASDKPANATAAAAKEASELFNAGVEKLKNRSKNLKFNLKDVISKEFEEYADQNLKDGDYVVDENGKRVVKIDGNFIQQHGNEVVPVIVRGAVGSFLKAILGTDPIKDAEKKTEGTENADETTESADENKEETKAESKYHVEFDFAEAVGNAIRNAQVSPAPETKEEQLNRDQGREILVEGARIVEDSLNGKPSVDAKDRFEAAMNRADMSDADKDPKDIQAIDEKHQKILEMSRQFEKDMNADK